MNTDEKDFPLKEETFEIIGICMDVHRTLGQALNYLKISNCKIALLVNFGRSRLEYKRLIY